uniref:SDR family NAD(P)-dependent oxidoreductase n=1 Tax=Desertihabitans aurantiacus TaxID=2282477 RepID=UPI000DF7CC69
MTRTSGAPAGTERSAVVTGAGGGLGRAIALRLAREGYAVAALDLPGAGLD